MKDISPQALKMFASGAFGVAAALLAVVVYQILRAEKQGRHTYADPSQRRTDKRKRACEKSPAYAVFLAVLRIPAGMIARLDLEFLRKYVRDPYTRAGYPGGMDDDEVVTLAILLALGASATLAFMLSVAVGGGYTLLALLGIPVGFFGVIASLQNRAEQRQKQVLIAMPYVLDLLVLILRSGTSLNLALARVVADYVDHPVGEELGQTLSEIEMGAPRTEAIQRLADRMKHPDISSLAESMIQSEELGWPLADTLAHQADRMAAERIFNAQATAGAAGVWVMLPSTLVLMGAVLLLFGPIIVRYLQGDYNLN